MPQEDDEAAELEHAEEIGFVQLPASDQSAEVMQPGEEPFDLPAAAIAAEFSAILGSILAVAAIRSDHADAVLAPQLSVERIAVVSRIANHPFGLGPGESVVECGLDEVCFMWRRAGGAPGGGESMAGCDRPGFSA